MKKDASVGRLLSSSSSTSFHTYTRLNSKIYGSTFKWESFPRRGNKIGLSSNGKIATKSNSTYPYIEIQLTWGVDAGRGARLVLTPSPPLPRTYPVTMDKPSPPPAGLRLMKLTKASSRPSPYTGSSTGD